MNPLEKTFTSSTLAEVAACSADTLRTWRNRNGLFPETAGKTGWNRYSIIDLCIARAVSVMIANGLTANDAVWYAEKRLRTPFQLVITGNISEDLSGIFAFSRKNAASEAVFKDYIEPNRLLEAIWDLGGAATILDVNAIHTQVVAALRSHGNAEEVR